VSELCGIATSAGVDVRRILDEVAAISSDRRHSMVGSIQSILFGAR